MKREMVKNALDALVFGAFMLGTLALFVAIWAVYP